MRSIAFRYGLMMFAGFTVFFLLMHVMSLSQHYYLRAFNGIIHLSFIFLAIKAFQKESPPGTFNYLSGVAMGMFASVIGVVGFTIFMLLFLIGNPGFMLDLKESLPIGEYLNPVTASLMITMEGIAVSVISSYIITRVIDMSMAKP